MVRGARLSWALGAAPEARQGEQGKGVWAGSREAGAGLRGALSHLEHRDGSRAVHLEVSGRLRAGLGRLVGARVAEAGVRDVQVAEGQRVLRVLEIVEVATARVEHEPAAAVAAQRALARQLLQVAAQPRWLPPRPCPRLRRGPRGRALANATLLRPGPGPQHRQPALQPPAPRPPAPRRRR